MTFLVSFVFVLISIFVPIKSFAQQKNLWIEIDAATSEDRTRLGTLGFEASEILSDRVFLPGSQKDLKMIEAAGFRVKGHTLKQEWLKPFGAGTAEKYLNYTETTARLKALSDKYPSVATLTSLGKSLEGRDVPLIRISAKTPVEAEVSKLPSVVFFGCHHAREYLSVAVPMRFAEYLVTEYATNPVVQKYLDAREIFIAPIVNPDGYVFDFGNAGDKKMWRKNRRANLDGTKGVDLNRNYSWGWGGPGASDRPSSETYRGTAAFSEPETRNVRDFLRSNPRTRALISFHSFSELVLYPWGHTNDPIGVQEGNPNDLPVFKKMAQDMAAWNSYTPQQSSDLYVASGDTVDWAYGELGIFGFTFELSPRNFFDGGFYPDPSMIPVSFEDNLKPMLYMLEYADDPYRVLKEKTKSFARTPTDFGIAIASPQDLNFNN
jgi:carboxypeptidase T